MEHNTTLAAEYTTAKHRAADDHPAQDPVTGTLKAAALAWSRELPADDTPTVPLPGHTWTATIGRATTLLLMAWLAAIAITVGGVGVKIAGNTDHQAAPAATTTATATPLPQPVTPQPPQSTAAAVPAAPALVPDSDPLTLNDHRFLAQLDRDGIPPRNPGSDGAAVATAATMCRDLQIGQTFQQQVDKLMTSWLTLAQAQAYVQDAAYFYCPHYAEQVN